MNKYSLDLQPFCGEFQMSLYPVGLLLQLLFVFSSLRNLLHLVPFQMDNHCLLSERILPARWD